MNKKHTVITPEKEVLKGILDFLQPYKNQGKLMFIRNNTGAIPIDDGKHKRRFIKFGNVGSPDILVWVPRSYALMVYANSFVIEAKSSVGKQTPSQVKWQEDFEKLGGRYYLVNSVDEGMRIIRNEVGGSLMPSEKIDYHKIKKKLKEIEMDLKYHRKFGNVTHVLILKNALFYYSQGLRDAGIDKVKLEIINKEIQEEIK